MQAEQKQKNSTINNSPIHTLANTEKQSSNFIVVFSPEKPWQYRVGIATSKFNFESENSVGSLIYQDIQYKTRIFSIGLRSTQYQTTNYDSRIYVHEGDLPSTFSMPAYSGKGMRNYLLLTYKVSQSLSLTTKIIHTKQQDFAFSNSLELRVGFFGTF